MSKPSHRHLLEQRWRSEGKLDMLMERLHQMNVLPDVLPVLHPSLDLHITARMPHKELRKSKQSNKVYEPGVFFTPDQTLVPPTLYTNVFHTDTRLYTLLMVDPDVPDEANQTFTSYLHWLVPNVPLSATNPRTRVPNLTAHTAYIPPHPQQGTSYHRYTLLLLPQAPLSKYTLNVANSSSSTGGKPTSQAIDVPVVSDSNRLGFSVRDFIKQYGLQPENGGGAYMFREVWDETVSAIYKDTLGVPEPKYGLPRKPDPYADVKAKRKYVLQ